MARCEAIVQAHPVGPWTRGALQSPLLLAGLPPILSCLYTIGGRIIFNSGPRARQSWRINTFSGIPLFNTELLVTTLS